MKTDKQWALRFGWLMGEDAAKSLARVWPASAERIERVAIKLGRQMADARAEEIAQLCYLSDGPSAGLPEAAAIARATITKPKEPKPLDLSPTTTVKAHEAAIRADEREKIAKMLDAEDCEAVAELVRGKPKTREQVLEEALRAILSGNQRCGGATGARPECRCSYVGCIARRALEWKPEETR